MPTSISQKIIVLREANELTQKQLAESVGVSSSLVRAWESGRSSPKGIDVRKKLDAVLLGKGKTFFRELMLYPSWVDCQNCSNRSLREERPSAKS